jgi:hypothetical protein
MPHKKILLDLRAMGLTSQQIADALGVKVLQVYRYGKAKTIPSRRLYQLVELEKQVRQKKSNLTNISTEKILKELVKRGLRVKIDE